MAVNPDGNDSLASKLGDSHVAIRKDLEISRHVFLGEVSYVVRDPISFDSHRFSPVDYEIVTSLQDSKPLAEIFQELVECKIVEADQSEDFYRFVVELQKRGLLSLPVTDGESLYQKFERRQNARSRNLLMKALFLKVPLGSPDRFLKSTNHLFRFLFTRAFFGLWMIGLLGALAIIVANWSDFTSQLASVLAIQNLPLILLVMSVLKLWHEMGHGYACRHFNVSVPSAGLLFMVGTPLAFVDASGSWSLSRRRDRQIINLAGIYFEMMIAIVAAFVWAVSENAWIQSIAHYTLLVSSITTIGFNINPLMKYDGYFVLSDMIGVPNLRSRSSFAIQSLAKSVFLRLHQSADQSRVLGCILVTYGLAASAYKMLLVIAISAMMAVNIWIVGLIVAAYYILVSFGTMLLKIVKYLCFSDEVKDRRYLANAYLGAIAIGVPTLLLMCPVPGMVQARGVAEHRTLHVVHLESGGFVKRVNVRAGEDVERGDILAEVENVESTADWNRRRAELAKLQLKYQANHGVDNLVSGKTAQAIDRLEYELSNARVTSRKITVDAPIQGQIVSCSYDRNWGGYVAPGEEILQIGKRDWIIRAVASAKSLAEIQPQAGQTVHCRFVSDPDHIFEGTISEVSISGSRIIRQPALTHLAGGLIPVEPATMQATEPFFDLIIELKPDPRLDFLRRGIVCEVRFQRSYESVGTLLHRSILRFVNHIQMKST